MQPCPAGTEGAGADLEELDCDAVACGGLRGAVGFERAFDAAARGGKSAGLELIVAQGAAV